MMKSSTLFIGAATFLVAFCSIVYELIFSQALTIIFGGTVLRYSVTIGLFLFSLGIGSFLYRYIKTKNVAFSFFVIEIALCIAGPLGLFFIIWLNSISHPFVFTAFGSWLLLILSHAPIIIVGILSGLELPALSSLYRDNNFVYEVLGIDYFGSLAGTLIYALVFYPHFGIIPAVLAVGILNMIVAFAFVMYYLSKKKWAVFVAAGLLIIYILAVANALTIQEEVSTHYLENRMQQQYWAYGMPATNITIQEHFTTPYQQVYVYDVTFERDVFYMEDRCLGLDLHVQLCDSWVEAYHNGLIDVPIGFFDDVSNLNVLVIGGGDWIGVRHLLGYDVDVTLVDIDEKFSTWAKHNSFLQHHHQDSFQYDKLTVHYTDGYRYLRNNFADQFDLIILDLPGLEHDKLLQLYSVEFFSYAIHSLTNDGLLVMWKYPRDQFTQYHNILLSTVRHAGFSYAFPYVSYRDDGDRDILVEYYMAFSVGSQPTLDVSASDYLTRFADVYTNVSWQTISPSDVRPNSVFRPNYNMIITRDRQPFPSDP